MKEHGEYDAPDEDDRVLMRREDEEENDSDFETGPSTSKTGANDNDDEDDSARLELADMQLINANLVRFTFDRENGKWCEIELEVKCLAILN
jgi:hypothetical protein